MPDITNNTYSGWKKRKIQQQNLERVLAEREALKKKEEDRKRREQEARQRASLASAKEANAANKADPSRIDYSGVNAVMPNSALRARPLGDRRSIDYQMVSDALANVELRRKKYSEETPTAWGEMNAEKGAATSRRNAISDMLRQYTGTGDKEMIDYLTNAVNTMDSYLLELDDMRDYIRQFDTPQQQRLHETEMSLEDDLTGKSYADIDALLAGLDDDYRATSDPAERALITEHKALLEEWRRNNPAMRTDALRNDLDARMDDLRGAESAYGRYNDAVRRSSYDAVMGDNYTSGDMPPDDMIIAQIDYEWDKREAELRTEGYDEATIAEYAAAYESAKEDPQLWWATRRTAKEGTTSPEQMASAAQGINGIESPWYIRQDIDRLTLDIDDSRTADKWRVYEDKAASAPEWDEYLQAAELSTAVKPTPSGELLGRERGRFFDLIPTKYNNNVPAEAEAYYQYIKDRYGDDMAAQYADYAEEAYVEPAMMKRGSDAAEKLVREGEAAEKFGAVLAARAVNALTGIPGAVDKVGTTIASWISGQPVAPGAAVWSPYTEALDAFSESVDTSVAEELNDLGTVNDVLKAITGKDIDIPAIGSFGWGDAYQSVISMVDSLLAIKTGGKGGFAAGIASDAYDDAFEKGYSGDQSLILGLASVLNEAVPELLALDIGGSSIRNAYSLLKTKGGFTLATLLYAGAAGVADIGIEALQEGATTFMNQGVDTLVGGPKSDFYTNVRDISLNAALRGQEVTDEEAVRAAKREQWEQIGRDAFAGAVGAVVPGITGAFTSAARDLNTYNDFQRRVLETGKTPKAIKGTPEAKRIAAEERKAKMKTAEGADSVVGDETVKVHGVTKTGADATVTITGEDGQTREVKLDDVRIGKSANSEVYAYAADMATPELANTFRLTYTPDQDISQVAGGMEYVHEMAEGGAPESFLRKTSLTSALNDDQFKQAYDLGKKRRVETIKAADEKATARLQSVLGNQWKGGTLSMGDVVEASLTEEQRLNVELVRVFAGISGYNVELFQSTANEAGRYTRENGSFNRATNTISLDVNAGRDYVGDSMAKTALLRTMSHEVTHAIKANSPAIYGRLQEAVLDVLSAQGIDIDERISAVMTRDSSVKSRADALEEIVSDACETMLGDSDVAQRFKEAHPEEARSLGEKILEFLKNLRDAIKKAFAGEAGAKSVEAKALLKDMDAFREIAGIWTEGALQTSEIVGRENGTAIQSEGQEVTEAAVEDMDIVGPFDEPAQPAEAHNSIDDIQFSRRDGFSTAGTKWALEEGLLTARDQAILHRTLANKDYLKYNVATTKDGVYVIPCDTVIVFGSGTYAKPIIEDVVIFNVTPKNYERAIEDAMEVLYGDERTYLGRVSKYEAHEALETLLQDGLATVFSRPVRTTSKAARAERSREGSSGRTASSGNRTGRSEKPVDDTRRSTRDPYEVSDREILANALEDATKNADEKAWLAAYKKDLAELNAIQAVLDENRSIIRSLQYRRDKKKETLTKEETERLEKAKVRAKALAKRLSERDRALLKVEAAPQIKAVLNRQREQYKAHERKEIELVRQTQANAAFRNRIARKVKRLDELLRNPTDQKHVPDELKAATLDMLKVFTDDTSVFSREKLERVRREYAELTNRDSDTSAAGMYDEDTAERIAHLAETIGGERLSRLTREQLDEVMKVVDHFTKLISDANTIFVNGRRERVDALAEEVAETTRQKGVFMENRVNMNALWKMLRLGQITPVYFFRRLGGVMGRLGNAILEGENTFGVNAQKSREVLTGIMKQYNHKEWADKAKDTLTFITESGDGITLTRGQALSIYATDKRERSNRLQNASHLATGGVVLHKGKLRLLKKTPAKADATPISASDVEQIKAWLTDEQKAYADAMVEYISKDMSKLGNETSIALHGYSKFGEGYYFPYRTSSDFRKTNLGDSETALLKSMGFTKSVIRNANTPIIVGDFTETVAEHVASMLMYNAFAEAQDAFMRVYDHKLTKSSSVKSMMKTAWGKDVTGYIEQFMRDVYGGVGRDRSDDVGNWLTSLMKRNAVLMSASVAIQQPSSIIRAMAYIDPKYFVGKPSRKSYEEALNYAGTTVIKDIGRFDTSTGRTVGEWLVAEEYEGIAEKAKAVVADADYRDDLMGKGPEVMDRMTWGAMWNAVKREQAAETGLDINSEELKQIAGRRFDEVMRLTQVYDSVLAKSELMRSKSWYAKSLTAFMAEPTVTYNMVVDAWADKHNSGAAKAKRIGRVMGAVMGSAVLNSLLKSLVYAARDDDDEEATYWERYVGSVSNSLASEALFINSIPLAKDVLSVFMGYDVTRSDMTVISDLKAIWDTMGNEKKKPMERIHALANGIGIITKMPVKNVWRDVEAALNTIHTFAEKKEPRKGWFENSVKYGFGSVFGIKDTKANSTAKLLDAAISGDSEAAAELQEHMRTFNGMEEKQIRTSLTNTLKARFEDGGVTEKDALRIMVDYAGYTKHDAEAKIAKWKYDVDTENEFSDMQDDFIEGNINEADAVSAMVEYGGKTEREAKAAVEKWKYQADTGDRFTDIEDMFVRGEMTRADAEKALTEYGGYRRAEAEDRVQQWQYEIDTGRKYSEMKDDYLDGTIKTNREAEEYRVKYGGQEPDAAKASVMQWQYDKDTGRVYSEMRYDYADGVITRKEAEEYVQKYGLKEPDEAYWTVEGWEYESEGESEWSGKFTHLNDAMKKSSQSDIDKAISQVYANSSYKDEDAAASAVVSAITSEYKPLYIAASEAERERLETLLLYAYRRAYELVDKPWYGDSRRLKTIRKWLETDD